MKKLDYQLKSVPVYHAPPAAVDDLCPICGAHKQRFNTIWRCPQSGCLHYWQWRTARGRQLQRDNALGWTAEDTAEREAWLAEHKVKYDVWQ